MNHHQFRHQLKHDFLDIIRTYDAQLPADDRLKIDLHCHDYNSDVPDELWGRILNVSETWVSSKSLLKRLKMAGCNTFTITNHNNARSCWELLDKGYDILAGAEFTCHFPDYPVSVHVLCYGFTPTQEQKLLKHRHHIYKFLEYTNEQDLPTVLAHPLYYHTVEGYRMELDMFERFALLFERFECFNGQRDVWQNTLTSRWVQSLTEENIYRLSKKHGIKPGDFCSHPYRKVMTGGSDDHFAIFAGDNGSYLHVPNLKQRLKKQSAAELALEALRQGNIAPYGTVSGDEKLSAALINYLCQLGLNMKDAGLIRLLLHQGSWADKVGCLLVGNAILEVQRHHYTMRFFKAVNGAFRGKKVSTLDKLLTAKDYRPIIHEIEYISEKQGSSPEEFYQAIGETLPRIFDKLVRLVNQRLDSGFHKDEKNPFSLKDFDFEQCLTRFEIPLHFRAFSYSDLNQQASKNMTQLDIGKLLDQLSFPVIATILIAFAGFLANRELYGKRHFLDVIGATLEPQITHPKRALWLTDTLYEQNGVSTVLQQMLDKVRKDQLPIDFLICSNTVEPGPNLIVVPSLATFQIPGFEQQTFNIPNVLSLLQLTKDGGYDRIVSSTEILMGTLALFLKHALQLPTYFYMHTDWMDFIAHNSSLERHELDRLRRVLRLFYKAFDGIFVLNHEHAEWLSSNAIGIAKEKIHRTAHWVSPRFKPVNPLKQAYLHSPFILFVGRLSEEKGVFDLPEILKQVQKKAPHTTLVIAGEGPAKKKLKKQLPQAIFMGWVEKEQLPALYSAAQMLVLPSHFDTFGCVLLEAMQCATPAAAYNCKGPADIIHDRKDGLLANNAKALGKKIGDIISQPKALNKMSKAAIAKTHQYNADTIMKQLLKSLKLLH